MPRWLQLLVFALVLPGMLLGWCACAGVTDTSALAHVDACTQDDAAGFDLFEAHSDATDDCAACIEANGETSCDRIDRREDQPRPATVWLTPFACACDISCATEHAAGCIPLPSDDFPAVAPDAARALPLLI